LNNNKLINEKLIGAFRWSVLPLTAGIQGSRKLFFVFIMRDVTRKRVWWVAETYWECQTDAFRLATSLALSVLMLPWNFLGRTLRSTTLTGRPFKWRWHVFACRR